jgi:hypothetical protein
MSRAVDYLNERSLEEIIQALPQAQIYRGNRVIFDYRIYSHCDLGKVDKLYVLLDGFGVKASSPDSGIKNLLADLILKGQDQKYAVLVVGGLYSFPASVRSRLLRQGSGALAVVAQGVADLIQATFTACRTATVSGYSLGGVLAPLVSSALATRGVVRIDQVGCAEPSYAAVSSSKTQLLNRVARGTAYRNEQIASTAIKPYIMVKTTPPTRWAMLNYRLNQYRPLLWRLASMRLVVRDLALQAHDYPPASRDIQIQPALLHLAARGTRINLLHAEHSSVCHGEPFTRLVNRLETEKATDLLVITIQGPKADHGIEERRTLSAPFLVKPEMYWATADIDDDFSQFNSTHVRSLL